MRKHEETRGSVQTKKWSLTPKWSPFFFALTLKWSPMIPKCSPAKFSFLFALIPPWKGRQSSTRTSVRKEKAFSTSGIDKVINTKCCKNWCTKKVLNRSDVSKCRKVYRSLSEEEQRSFILRFFTFSVYHHQGNKVAPWKKNDRMYSTFLYLIFWRCCYCISAFCCLSLTHTTDQGHATFG